MANVRSLNTIAEQLKQAVEGLLWASETDAPFEVIVWTNQKEPITVKSFLHTLHLDPAASVESVEFEQFFGVATQEQDWYEAEEKEISQRFRQLVQLLESELQNLQVFKLGKIEQEIYIIGESQIGGWVGLKTKAIET